MPVVATFMACAALATGSPAVPVRALLRNQGFEWPLNGQLSRICYAGKVRQRDHSYDVYVYNGVNPSSGHGINLFVVVMDRVEYLGVYEAGTADACLVHQQNVKCKADYPGREIRFTRNGPPRQIWFDGEFVDLVLSPRYRTKKGW